MKTFQISKRQKTTLQIAFLYLLVFLAFVRWIPGGDELNPTTGLRGYIEVGLLIMALIAMFLFWGKQILTVGFSFSYFKISLMFCFWAGLSVLWSLNPVSTLGKSLDLILITILAAGIAHQINKENIHNYYHLLIAAIFFICFIFLINLYYYNQFLPVDWSSARPRLRLGLDHPNGTGSYLGLFTLFAAISLFQPKKHLQLFVDILLVLTFFSLMFLTDSRTSILTVLISLIILAFVKLRVKYLSTIFVFFIAILINTLFILNVIQVWQPIINWLYTEHLDWVTLTGRTILWENILTNYDWTNWKGFGYSGSRLFIYSVSRWASHSHNSFIEILIDTGYPGLILGIALMLIAIKKFFHLIFIDRNNLNFNIYILLFLYTFIPSLTETRFLSPNITMFIFFLSLQLISQKPPISAKNAP